MANVLFLYPHAKLLGRRIPYTFLPLAAYLLKYGHKVRILDTQVEDYQDVNLNDFDVVGITTLTGPQIKNAVNLARYVKQKSPTIPVVFGGVHPTLTAKQAIRNNFIDVICLGEGEQTFLELVEAIEKKKPLSEIRGIIFKNGEQLFETPRRDFIDLNDIPMLPYHLLKLDRYEEFSKHPFRFYMETSRGCPHRCAFCYGQRMHNRKWRAKTAQRVLDEIEYLVKNYKVDELWFADDEPATSKKRFAEICNGLIDRNLKVKWTIGLRCNYGAKYEVEFFELLKKAGCDTVFYGVESGSVKMLEIIKKDITIDQIVESVRRTKQAGINCSINFITGIPGETEEDLKATFSLIDKLRAVYPEVHLVSANVYTPLPGTDLLDVAMANGFVPPASLEQWGDYLFNDIDNLPWLSAKMRSVLRTISLLTRFDCTSDVYRPPWLVREKPLYRMIHKILWMSASLRWKHKFFALPVEWRAASMGLKLFGFSLR